MANPTVEKLKVFGLRHGEKIVVGLSAAVFLLLVVKAVSKPVIQLTPAEVKAAADSAKQNIERPQGEEAILAKLADAGVVDSAFEKTVASREGQEVGVDQYALARPFAMPEPGAGLIRETVELLAATELAAHAGRGGINVYERDAQGNRIIEDPEAKKKAAEKKARARGSFAGVTESATPKKNSREEQAAKKKSDEDTRKLKRSITGKVEVAAEEEAAGQEPEYKEIVKGHRWVALTGVFDYKRQREEYAKALKLDIASAYPDFVRLDLQRQVRDVDGEWSEWETVDYKKNEAVFEDLTEAEPDENELTAPESRVETVTALLPFLRNGYWQGVHHYKLVSQEVMKAKTKALAPPATTVGMMPGGMEGMASADAMMMSSMGRGGPGGMEGMMPGMEMMPGAMGMGGAPANNFPKTEAEQIMVRSLDFTVEPDTVYRYKVRIVVRNPNKNRGDVAPGVDSETAELFGPWSEPTDEANVPADVTTYAVGKALAAGKGGNAEDQIGFQVVSWNPETGVTAVRPFEASPGEVIGEMQKVFIPNDKEEEKDTKPTRQVSIDFNSHQVLVDASVGNRSVADIGLRGAGFDVPAMALVLRPDGALVIRNQAIDAHNPEMKEMEKTYKQSLQDANDKKNKSAGPGMAGGSESMYSGMRGR
jgi:hypothetical protein